MLLLVLALVQAAPDPRFAGLRARIDQYCNGQAACVQEQKKGVGHFLGIMTLYSPPDAVSEGCMKAATRNKLTDWPSAASCLRKWAKR